MDTGTFRDELVASIRFPVGEECWLTRGAVVTFIVYGIWVGATAAALTVGMEFAGRSLTVDPWTTTTTAVFGSGFVAWVLVPAAVVTTAVSRGLTNVSGNIARCYRFQYPSLLTLLVFPGLSWSLSDCWRGRLLSPADRRWSGEHSKGWRGSSGST